MKTLALEKRDNIEQAWEAYDPNMMEIRLTLWIPRIIEVYSSLNDYTD
jgi:hypothetical protein